MMSMDSAKPGTETPSSATTRTTRSTSLLRFTAASMPSGRAITQEMTAARMVSSAVTWKRVSISGSISAPERKDWPKSPRSTPPIQLKYCVMAGWSSP